MQIDQFLRRATWRVRRQLRPSANNDPIVSVEPPTPTGPDRDPSRRRTKRGVLRVLIAIAVAGLAGALLMSGRLG